METDKPKDITLDELEIKIDEIADIGFKNGDLHDEDSGEFFCNLTYDDAEMKLPPAKLSIYIDGFWYVYNMHARYKEGEASEKSKEE